MAEDIPTPPRVQAAATNRDALHTGALTLVGTFIKTRPEALVRYRSGKIEKVTLGDTVARQTVAAINDGLLVLMRNGEVTRLTMPSG